jgi:hypothetical protein
MDNSKTTIEIPCKLCGTKSSIINENGFFCVPCYNKTLAPAIEQPLAPAIEQPLAANLTKRE